MTATRDMAPVGRRTEIGDRSAYLDRWLQVWVALLAVVTLVVVAYLIFITGSLASINKNLAVADNAVTGAGGDVVTLPDQVEQVNSSLDQIDRALKPIPDQGNQIISSLTSINGRLTTVDSSLKDTSSVLVGVLGQVGSISNVLIDAYTPGDNLGVTDIHQRVAHINGVVNNRGPQASQGFGFLGANPNGLTQAEGDAKNILSGLVDVNKHLVSICKSAAVSVVGGPKPC
jgi:hypothetical protein